jgi:hypothetical protein
MHQKDLDRVTDLVFHGAPDENQIYLDRTPHRQRFRGWPALCTAVVERIWLQPESHACRYTSKLQFQQDLSLTSVCSTLACGTTWLSQICREIEHVAHMCANTKMEDLRYIC